MEDRQVYSSLSIRWAIRYRKSPLHVSFIRLYPISRTRLTTQFKSATSGHTGQLGEISKQEIESAFFDDNKNIKDKSLE